MVFVRSPAAHACALGRHTCAEHKPRSQHKPHTPHTQLNHHPCVTLFTLVSTLATHAGQQIVRFPVHCSNPLFFSTRENAQPDQKHLMTGKPGSPTGEANGVTNLPAQ